jgi:hypothetical protein
LYAGFCAVFNSAKSLKPCVIILSVSTFRDRDECPGVFAPARIIPQGKAVADEQAPGTQLALKIDEAPEAENCAEEEKA